MRSDAAGLVRPVSRVVAESVRFRSGVVWIGIREAGGRSACMRGRTVHPIPMCTNSLSTSGWFDSATTLNGAPAERSAFSIRSLVTEPLGNVTQGPQFSDAQAFVSGGA